MDEKEKKDRIDWLRRLIRERYQGSQADFARAIRKPASLVNNWLHGERGLGDASLRNIESHTGEVYGLAQRRSPDLQVVQSATKPQKLTDEEDLLLRAYRVAPRNIQKIMLATARQAIEDAERKTKRR